MFLAVRPAVARAPRNEPRSRRRQGRAQGSPSSSPKVRGAPALRLWSWSGGALALAWAILRGRHYCRMHNLECVRTARSTQRGEQHVARVAGSLAARRLRLRCAAVCGFPRPPEQRSRPLDWSAGLLLCGGVCQIFLGAGMCAIECINGGVHVRTAYTYIRFRADLEPI